MKKFKFVLVYIILFLPCQLFAEQKDYPTLNSVIPSIGNLGDFLAKIIEYVLRLGVPIVVLFFVIAGFKYVLARGNKEKIQEAHTMLKYTVFGSVLLLGSFAIAVAIHGTLQQFLV